VTTVEQRFVLITGAAGRIGCSFREQYGERYRFRLVDRQEIANAGGHVTRIGDLSDLSFARKVCEGIDTVVHLAADPSPRARFYESLLEANIQVTYNVFAAAQEAGCRRVIFASSNHAVNAYPLDRQVHPDDPVRPGDLYGVTKCFGEALLRYFADRHGLRGIALRIGAFQPPEVAAASNDPRLLCMFISPRDLGQLLHKCIEAPDDLQYAIFNGVSDNQFKRLDISNARDLVGYAPEDNAFTLSESITLKERRPEAPDF
jgi:nucleoside-diphosphate-sugar epimerase